MQLAHAVRDQLLRVRVVDNLERGVLFHEAIHALAKVVVVLRVHGLDGQRHDRIGHEHGLHGERELLLGDERVTGGAVNAEQGTNITGERLVNILLCSKTLFVIIRTIIE
jgi:hypothetical protein